MIIIIKENWSLRQGNWDGNEEKQTVVLISSLAHLSKRATENVNTVVVVVVVADDEVVWLGLC